MKTNSPACLLIGPVDSAASPVAELVEFSITAELTCVSCGHSSRKEELYRDITLDCVLRSPGLGTSEPVRPLNALLDQYFQPERCEVRCDKCQGTGMLMTKRVNMLPTYFIAHLNRFHVDMESNQVVKIAEAVDIPLELDMNPWRTAESKSRLESACSAISPIAAANELDSAAATFESSNCVYKLKAIIRHVGVGTVSGHYIIDIRTLDQWTRYNDLMVVPVTEVRMTCLLF